MRGMRFLSGLIMAWLTLRFIFGWLPMIRSLFDGPSYQWGTSWFGWNFAGNGTEGDFLLLPFMVLIGFIALWTGRRRIDAIFVPLLLLLGIVYLVDGLYLLFADNGDYWFHGDTLGIHVNLAYAVPISAALMLVASLIWIRNREPALTVSMKPLNWILIGGALALLPLQYWLLSSGSGQDSYDSIGVMLTIGQWVAFSFGMKQVGARSDHVLEA